MLICLNETNTKFNPRQKRRKHNFFFQFKFYFQSVVVNLCHDLLLKYATNIT